jgi:hypothetical protein
MLKQPTLVLTALCLCILLLSSCDAIEAIFKAGMWTMVIIIIAVVALIAWLVKKTRK